MRATAVVHPDGSVDDIRIVQSPDKEFGLDDQARLAWVRKAADQGHAAAQFSLGFRYDTGQGVPQDYVEAHKWNNFAASRATGDTQKQYAQNRDALAQTAEARQRAAEWQAVFERRQSE